MKYLWILLPVLLVLSSCRKEPPVITVSGTVFNPSLQIPVEGATVKLKGAKVESGVYNPSYSLLMSAQTDANGHFTMELDKGKVSGYRFVIQKDNYFDIEQDVKTETLEAGNSFSKNFDFYSKAFIHLKVKNTSPQSMDDKIQYRYANVEAQGEGCCNNDAVTGTGPSYSAENTCATYGEKWIVLTWVVTKNGNQHLYKDSVYTESFKTKNFNINY